MSHAPHHVPPSPPELAARWQALGQEWAHWYARAASGLAGGSAAAIKLPAAIAPRTIDPQKLAELNAKYQARWEALWSAATVALVPDAQGPRPIPDVTHPAPDDHRFAAREWRELPYFALLKQGYLLFGEYLNEIATLAELPEQEKRRLAFLTKQYVDALAPTNFLATNPEVLNRALSTQGASLARGLANLAADARRGRISMSDDRAFEVGRNLALTPGSVVFRNDLIELLQYAPTTARVRRRPLVIVPPCINKYYILDLQPENSYVRWAVGEGHTVFMLSWRNIPPELGRSTWDDYLEQGVLTAIGVAREIADSKTINALGFCVGGTFLACALALASARGERSVASVTLLTTMLDFADPGDIGVYISRDFLTAREPALMAGQRIHGAELAAAFASLRANDLIWSYVVGNYLKGETPPA
ncbi:MAG: class I poly(R)-hydroxyalkanoic acid synthase, partial [Casimicrobiaceae bacterium]